MPQRVRSIDLLRGLIMVLMAVDHVRVFAGVPAGGPTAGLFFTRWITHFCAPGFVFLAGTSAYLYGARAGVPALARFLLGRGGFLIVLELTVLRAAWTFNGDAWNYNLAGVIWMIGWCLLALAALVRLPLGVVASLGAAIVLAHNAIEPLAFAGGETGALARVLYTGGDFRLGGDGPRIVVLYSLVPWVGLIALGYAFGRVMTMPGPARDRWCVRIGVVATLAFLVLRGFNVYGDPRPWNPAPPGAVSPLAPLFSFLNTAKYPASMLFLLMTLGPSIAALPLLERWRGGIGRVLEVFGRVPLFYYVLHIPAIHVAAIVVSLLRTGAVSPWLFATTDGTPLDETRVRKAFKATLRKAMLPLRFVPHSLRHTYATLMLSKGAPLIRALASHSSDVPDW
jgi:uncharacterized membrane protein